MSLFRVKSTLMYSPKGITGLNGSMGSSYLIKDQIEKKKFGTLSTQSCSEFLGYRDTSPMIITDNPYWFLSKILYGLKN